MTIVQHLGVDIPTGLITVELAIDGQRLTDVAPTAPLLLHGSCLLSKFGFHDGEILDDWWWEQCDADPPWPDDREAAILQRLVRTHLLPALEAAGHTTDIYEIESIHNPIRASTFDGHDIDGYADRDHLTDVAVSVPAAEVLAAVERCVGVLVDPVTPEVSAS